MTFKSASFPCQISDQLQGKKIRILGLHGKGTSGRIMKSQIKPITEALRDLAEFEYLDGGVPSAPYHGIERLFPGHSCWAWYETPTCNSLRLAYDRINQTLYGSRLSLATVNPMFPTSLLSPLETPNKSACLSRQSLAHSQSVSKHASGFNSPGLIATTARINSLWQNRTSGLMKTGLETPDWNEDELRNLPVSTTYDGVICFSQGCAVATGVMMDWLEKQNHYPTTTPHSKPPIKFAILICGGRPFSSGERVQLSLTPPLPVTSLHIVGKHDSAKEESRKLSLLYDSRKSKVLELDIGHYPPRRSHEVEMVVAAARSIIEQTCC